MRENVLITCAHCGEMFQISIPTKGSSATSHGHSTIKCNKRTNVTVVNGSIIKTEKSI